MNNSDVKHILDSCKSDLYQVKTIINSLGLGSSIVPYLTHYATIRACGTIETAFKSIIADFCAYRSKIQVKSFLEAKIRENSCNPSYSNICSILKSFDDRWHSDLKSQVDAHINKSRLLTSLQSLVDARNSFAHGGNPSASISDVINYYDDSREVIELLDLVVI